MTFTTVHSHLMRFFAGVKSKTYYAPVEFKKGAQGLVKAYQGSVLFGILVLTVVGIVLNDFEKMPVAVGTLVLVMAGLYLLFLVVIAAMYAGFYLLSLLFMRPLFIIKEGRLQILFAGAETTTEGEDHAQAE